MSRPTYSDADIRRSASAESFLRGREYQSDGAVETLIQRGSLLYANVQGSDDEPYRVRVTFTVDSLEGATCTCLYNWGGWCKHIVAALLAAREQPEMVEERESLTQLLTRLSREQLQTLVLQLADDDPELAEIVEEQAQIVLTTAPLDAATTKTSLADAATPPRPTPPPPSRIDVSVLRRQVRLGLVQVRSGRGARRGYASVSDASSELAEAVEQAEQLLAVGDGRHALSLLDMLTEEFFQVWDELDDSDGESSPFFEDLGALWAEALLTADSTRPEQQAWIQKLEAWQEELSDYGLDDCFDVALVAARQGWDDPRIQRALRGEDEDGAAAGRDGHDGAPAWSSELLDAYLNVLERQGRQQEYLSLARATGQMRRYATMLARLGRGDDALSAGRAYLSTVTAAHELALALWEHGDRARALESAEFGIRLDGPKEALASWLRDRAAELGQTARALTAAEIAFRDALSLATYLKVQELSRASMG